MTILAELIEIETKNGILRPEDVVEFAKDKETALHDRFEWNDTKAAIQHRLHQARQIITAQVTVLGTDNFQTQAFVSLSPDRQEVGGGYRSIVKVLSDVELHGQLMADALAELNVFKRKYRHLLELSEVFQAIESLARKPARRRQARG